MSKVFYDHLIILEDVDKEIKKSAKTREEREELWGLVDEMVHHRALDTVLDRLPKEDHEEFLDYFHKKPNDEKFLIDYLKNKIGQNIEELLRQQLGELASEILAEMGVKKK